MRTIDYLDVVGRDDVTGDQTACVPARDEEETDASDGSEEDRGDDSGEKTGLEIEDSVADIGENLAALEEMVKGESDLPPSDWTELSHRVQLVLVAARVDSVRKAYESEHVESESREARERSNRGFE